MCAKAWPQGSVEDRVAGDVVLVGIEGGTVKVSLQGACRHCAMASSTLTDFVAERIKLYAPEITDVVAE